MQTEEHAKFRLNGQVVIVIGILLIALALPIAMVIVALKPAKKAGAAPAAQTAEPLEKALTEIVDKNFAPTDLDTKESRVSFTVADPAAAGAKLEKAADELGGMSLPATRDGNTVRLTAAVPSDRVDDFLKACQGKDLKSTIRKDGEARILITVVISSETP